MLHFVGNLETRHRLKDLFVNMTRVYSSPLGPLLIESDATAVYKLTFLFDEDGSRDIHEYQNQTLQKATKPLKMCIAWLDAYFDGTLSEKSPPLPPLRFNSSSPFFKKVWNAMLDTKLGDTVTYGELARTAGSQKAARAVGQAVKSHNLPILVPCHRVLHSGSKKGVTGKYSGGCGLETKVWLLEHEKHMTKK